LLAQEPADYSDDSMTEKMLSDMKAVYFPPGVCSDDTAFAISTLITESARP
jgi:hypothetical protein